MRDALTRPVPMHRVVLAAVLVLATAFAFGATDARRAKPALTAPLVPSTAAAGCLPDAAGSIQVFKQGNVEKMTVSVSGLPGNKNYDVFVIQQPDPTFGLTWYQGDLSTDKTGKGSQSYVGRFSIETFIVAPGSQPAPVVHSTGTFPDASSNPATAPVHTFHVGVWFDSPADAQAAGCPNTETPFNGTHTAGVQVVKTEDVGGRGPLAQVQ